MKQRTSLLWLLAVALLLPAALLIGCASPGTPSGGPRDEHPPRFLRANPEQGAVNVDQRRMELYFDELVNVKDAFSKVVISPTAAEVPKVMSLGRRVRVQFGDTLQPNTTYTIDFADAIEDNNEANPLQGFSYTFSTGPEIDTLRISGMVLDAETLEPQKGMLVGLHTAVEDTTFSRVRLERVAKTDDRGRFTLRGLKQQPYWLFALADLNNDYRWDNPEENIAFLADSVVPYATTEVVTDTIYNLQTAEVDSTRLRQRTGYFPNDILLSSFNINRRTQYLKEYAREDSTRLRLVFNTRQDSLPRFAILGEEDAAPGWAFIDRSATNDTITLWLKPERLVRTDTLHLATSYLLPDSAKSLYWHSDTLRFITKRPRGKAGKDKEQVPDSLNRLKVNAPSQIDIFQRISVDFPTPIDTMMAGAVAMEMKVDTLWKPASGMVLEIDSLTRRRLYVDFPWKFGQTYKLSIDSVGILDIYGKGNAPLKGEMKVKEEDSYSSLKMKIIGLADSVPAYVDLLNGSDAVVRRQPVVHGEVTFKYVDPNTYYARLVEDLNGNGLYDTGDYEQLKQPEVTWYYPKSLKLRANWDVTQDWDLHSTAVDLQKPDAIKKNKPDRKKGEVDTGNGYDDEDDDETFDPTRNPFDPNSSRKNTNNAAGYRR